ncbi:MAG TPA: SPFH domain-containing protein [Planctomycetota bacterium]|nr:SPFH domain-containing protein [Planctomycetota bacterium]
MQEIVQLILTVVFFPITILGSWVTVSPNEEIVILRWGSVSRIVKEPGLYWVNMWGREVRRVSLAKQTLELPKNTVADGNGNPIVVAGIVTFAYEDPEKVAIQVKDAHDFVRSRAQAVLKQIASRYPYEAKEGHSLKSEAGLIGPELVKTLQAKVSDAGCKVLSFELSDLAYAPEIAQSMLIRQQAMALVDARKTIVEGAVDIVSEAVELLEKKGLAVTGDTRSRLVTNLLTVICGEAKVQPTVSISTGGDGSGDAETKDLLRGMLSQLERMPKASA